MSIKLEFDSSVSQETKDALKERQTAVLDPKEVHVGDYFRLYPVGSEEGYTFKCIGRRHEITPDPLDEDAYEDEVGSSRLVFILSAI